MWNHLNCSQIVEKKIKRKVLLFNIRMIYVCVIKLKIPKVC